MTDEANDNDMEFSSSERTIRKNGTETTGNAVQRSIASSSLRVSPTSGLRDQNEFKEGITQTELEEEESESSDSGSSVESWILGKPEKRYIMTELCFLDFDL